MSLPTQRLRRLGLGHHATVVLRQPGYEKTFSCAVRRFTPQESEPHKSAPTPPLKPVSRLNKRVAPKTFASVPLKATRRPLGPTMPNSAVNPPPTARPPTLALPERNSADPIYKHYFKIGKGYLNFYKTGLKGIYTNYTIAKSLSNRGFAPLIASRSILFRMASNETISRADLQLFLRLRADAKVLPLFALVFICCGEFTPLLVPFLTAIVPPTIRLPSQIKRHQEKAEKWRQQVRMNGPSEWRNIHNIWDLKPPEMEDKNMRPFSRRLAIELGLYPAWWEKLPMYMSLVSRRLDQSLSDLRFDDLMIRRDGGVEGMLAEEVIMACDRRGMTVQKKEEKELREMLEQWLDDGDTERARILLDWVNRI